MLWILVIIPAVIVIAALVHLMLTSRPYRPGKILEIWVVHIIFWGIGIFQLIMGFELGVEPSATAIAQQLGWPVGNPFQEQVAGHLIGLGVTGIAVAWFRGGWLVAVSMAAIVFGWGETILFIVAAVPLQIWILTVVYNLMGSLILIALLLLYRWRAGSAQFWKPTVDLFENDHRRF